MNTDKSLLKVQSQPSFLGAVIGRVICSFKGHFPEKYLNETDGWICTTRCKRCHSTLMGGFTWKIKHIPPPNSNEQQIKEWEKYCEDKWKSLRETCL
tara:strand:+ start:921 stop:1211 length:291 start_codon:yes stop_codon:yes gene_type:complete